MARPITVAYYYRVRWGALDEFIELFERNHWPILRDQLDAGRFLDVRAATPRLHGDGRADWNFLVTITFRDWAAMEDHSEAEIAARLFPDQERYAAEERPSVTVTASSRTSSNPAASSSSSSVRPTPSTTASATRSASPSTTSRARGTS
jgi:hypothetical protein